MWSQLYMKSFLLLMRVFQLQPHLIGQIPWVWFPDYRWFVCQVLSHPWRFHNIIRECISSFNQHIHCSIYHIWRFCNDVVDLLAHIEVIDSNFVDVCLTCWPFFSLVFLWKILILFVVIFWSCLFSNKKKIFFQKKIPLTY